jgi:hypothetical protein
MSRAGLAALASIQRELRAVLHSLDANEWGLPAPAAGRVADVAARCSAAARQVVRWAEAGEVFPPGPVGEAPLAALLAERQGWPPGAVWEEYEDYAESALVALEAAQVQPLASVPLSVPGRGTHPAHLLADALAFDHYCALRHDILQPLGPVSRRLMPAEDSQLGPAIGWLIASLPASHANGIPALVKPIRLELTGPGGGSWVLSNDADGQVLIDEGGSSEVTATVTSSAHAATAWISGRSPWRSSVILAGDVSLAASVLESVRLR